LKTKPSYRMISWVAETYNVHPQTLRLWEREGLLQPNRSQGNTRLYDEDACRRLETILTLTRDLGVNLAGVEIIINLRDQLTELKRENENLSQALRQLVHEQSDVPRYHALVRVETGSLQIMEEE
jgi:MerR family transcriptional regulator, heat shock protein HspR